MSSENGGRGTPPEPPEDHGPPEQQPQAIVISKTVTQPAKLTTAERHPDGTISVSIVVFELGEAVQYVYYGVGEQGKASLREAVTGGLEIPG